MCIDGNGVSPIYSRMSDMERDDRACREPGRNLAQGTPGDLVSGSWGLLGVKGSSVVAQACSQNA